MDFPAAIQTLVAGSHFDPVHIGKSDASVFKVTTAADAVFLKTCGVATGDLSAEAARLRWLFGKTSVPRAIAFARDDEREYLLLSALPGLNGLDAGRERPHDVATGTALRRLHSVPIDGCPFD
jgi:aminoglycoside 3'-phosphotransferase II